MPLESRLFVKTSLIGLLLTFVLGAAMAIAEALGRSVPPILTVEHAHLGFVGWLVNVVIGIALWMLPLNRERFATTSGRYPHWMPLTCYGLLNGGLLLRIASEPAVVLHPSALASTLLGLSSVAQVGAIGLFVAVAWQRARPPSHPAPGVR
ncbi:MAG: hypothetical protein ACREM6_04345 [Vulcanimicrobiaceae bacterium]